MKTRAICLLSIVGCLAGCSASVSKHADSASAFPAIVAARAAESKSPGFVEMDQDLTADTDVTPATVADARKAGDFVVFQFEGSYRNAPLELTERVVDRTEKTITVQFAFKEKAKSTTVQVTTNLEVGHSGEVLDVKTIDAKGVATPADKTTYETLMAMTVASTDVNDAELSSEPSKISVGDKQLDVTATTYRVKIGANGATMKTLSSDGFAWGDVGGEIKTDQGGVFYKATLVGMGADPSSVASIDSTKPVTKTAQ